MTTKDIIIATPIPIETRTYKPVSHASIIQNTLEAIDMAGFTIKQEIYRSNRDGLRANGRYHLLFDNNPEIGIMVGWQNSYDKSLTFKFAIGAAVFICSNGQVRGDMGAYKKKHSGEIQTITPKTITEYINKAGDNFAQLIEDNNRLKEKQISKTVQAELLGRMFVEENIITSTQLGIIKKEIECPTHSYEEKGSMWELYNYTTFALKDAHVTNWFEQHESTHKFFMENV